MSVVEGEKLKITCTVLGTDPVVEWRVGMCTYEPESTFFYYFLHIEQHIFSFFSQIARETRQVYLKEKSPDYMVKGNDDLLYEPVEALVDDRFSYKDFENVENAMLIINATVMDDRGRYNCTAKNKATLSGETRYKVSERGCYVRVKGEWLATVH